MSSNIKIFRTTTHMALSKTNLETSLKYTTAAQKWRFCNQFAIC